LYSHIGEKIRTQRERLGWTQERLGEALGVTANTVSRWETAYYKPTAHDLERLARQFGIAIWGLFPPEVEAPTEAQQALLSATGDLPAEDLAELGRYADFIRARKTLQEGKEKGSGGSRTSKRE
jgi:transcriptional regulator with XRE-family HTH domain